MYRVDMSSSRRRGSSSIFFTIFHTMSPELLETTFALLRLSLDAESLDSFLNRIKEHPLSKEDWATIYDFCKKQTIIGVVLVGVNKLPEYLRPPREILDHWICQGFYIHQQNIKMNAMCAKVTKMFADRGLRSVILKGQANARLYPDPFSRQCGDIDILVEGGKKNVIRHLKEMGLMEGANVSLIHANLDEGKFDGVAVEVHFKAGYAYSPIKGCNMQLFLKRELLRQQFMTPEGFVTPSLDFDVVMQLAHLRHHFIESGVGLRQIVDFFLLLRALSIGKKCEVNRKLSKMGLNPIASAVMWVLNSVFLLKKEMLLCNPCEKWGRTLLDMIVVGGNFGRFVEKEEENYVLKWLSRRKFTVEIAKFDAHEAIWREIYYWKMFAKDFPKRIKYRRLSLKNIVF